MTRSKARASAASEGPRPRDGCHGEQQRRQDVDEGEEEDQNAEDEDGGFDGDEDALTGDPTAVQATLGNVASGLAEQLSSITEEMNKIRQELYGEGGIGGIAKELDKLKAGGLGSLLDGAGLENLGGAGLGSGGGLANLASFSDGFGASSSSSASSSGGTNGRSVGPSGIGSAAASAVAAAIASAPAPERLRPSEAWDIGDGVASSSAAAAMPKVVAEDYGESTGAVNANDSSGGSIGGAARAEARRRRTPEERDHELEELRRKLMARNATKASQGSASKADAAVSMWEKIVLLFLVLVCLYVGSPFFRSSVKKALSAVLFGEVAEGWEAEGEDGEIEPDY